MKPSLTEQDFVTSINNIKELTETNSYLSKYLLCDYLECGNNVICNLVSCLQKLMCDDENEWIDYYLWELDFGKHSGKVMVDDKEIELTTPSDLYNLLIGKPKFKDQ